MGAKISGAAGSSRFNVEQNSEINVTPFVDVMLVLLIIFMVSAPLATVSIKLDLPPAQAPTNPNPEPPTFISLQESGALFIGPNESTITTLAADLNRIIGGTNPTEERVFVRADPEVRYESFMAVLNSLQDGGYFQIALVGEEFDPAAY